MAEHTGLNAAAKASRDLAEIAKELNGIVDGVGDIGLRNEITGDISYVVRTSVKELSVLYKTTAHTIKNAVHFALPEKSGAFAIPTPTDKPVVLPFDTVTLFFTVCSNTESAKLCMDTLIVAQRVDEETLNIMFTENGDFPFGGFGMLVLTRPHTSNVTIRKDIEWDIRPAAILAASNLNADGSYTFVYGANIHSAFKNVETTAPEVAEEIIRNADSAIGVVLEFCDQLSTTHTEEVIQQASPKNNRRILDGKLPIWEVKTLVLKTPVTRTVSEHQGGTHASPRQHIRRGHYRHYKSGKIAWVRDCIVGSLEQGFIHKDYRVEAAAA